MKNLKLDLKGAKALNKAQQRQINGGYIGEDCPSECGESGKTCSDPNFPTCTNFSCTESDGTKVTQYVCMP